MRPDRIVVGEVRGEECIDMLQAMNTGHDGSLTTLHAGTAEEVVLRLVMMARFGMDLPAALLEEQVATALDVVVMSKRLASGERRVTSMYTVRRSPEGRCELHEVVSYSESHNTWHLTHEPPYLTEGLATGQLSQEEVRSWRMHCA
jgi:pilus assembly protein CpaF